MKIINRDQLEEIKEEESEILIFKYVLLYTTFFNNDRFKREISFYVLNIMMSKTEFLHDLDKILENDKKFAKIILNN